MASLDHEGFMRRAIALTANCPRLPFGAVIVSADTGEVLAEGWNKSANNPTWPGENGALNRLPDSGPVFLSLYQALEDFAWRLLDAIGEHLGQPPAYFRGMVKDGNSVLRVSRYPDVGGNAPAGPPGIPA